MNASDKICRSTLCSLNIENRKDFLKWTLRAHPDKVPGSNRESATKLFQIVSDCVDKELFCVDPQPPSLPYEIDKWFSDVTGAYPINPLTSDDKKKSKAKTEKMMHEMTLPEIRKSRYYENLPNRLIVRWVRLDHDLVAKSKLKKVDLVTAIVFSSVNNFNKEYFDKLVESYKSMKTERGKATVQRRGWEYFRFLTLTGRGAFISAVKRLKADALQPVDAKFTDAILLPSHFVTYNVFAKAYLADYEYNRFWFNEYLKKKQNIWQPNA